MQPCEIDGAAGTASGIKILARETRAQWCHMHTPRLIGANGLSDWMRIAHDRLPGYPRHYYHFHAFQHGHARLSPWRLVAVGLRGFPQFEECSEKVPRAPRTQHKQRVDPHENKRRTAPAVKYTHPRTVCARITVQGVRIPQLRARYAGYKRMARC